MAHMTRERNGTQGRDASIRAFRIMLQDMTWASLRVQSRLLGQFGLTNMQALALKALSTSEAPLDMAQISELTVLPPSTITNSIDRLEHLGLAERQRHATDRRRVLVALTAAGTHLLARLDEAGLIFTTDLLGDVCDQDLSVLVDAMQGMMQKLEAFDEDSDSIQRLIG